MPNGRFPNGEHPEIAARLHASLTAPSLDPAVRARHVHALRERAATLPGRVPVVTSATSARGGLGRRLASAVSAAGLVLVMGASGAVAASHDTLPGQALYPVKEVTEKLVLAAPLPVSQAVNRRLSFADRRLREAWALSERQGDAALLAAAIAEHMRLLGDAAELAGGDVALAGRVDAATLTGQRRLGHLLDAGLPEVAASQARSALSAAEARLRRGAPAPGRPTAPPPRQVPPPAPEPRPDTPVTPTDPGPPDRAPDPAPRTSPPVDPAPPAERPGTPPPSPQRPPRPQPTAPGPAQTPPGGTEQGVGGPQGQRAPGEQTPFEQPPQRSSADDPAVPTNGPGSP